MQSISMQPVHRNHKVGHGVTYRQSIDKVIGELKLESRRSPDWLHNYWRVFEMINFSIFSFESEFAANSPIIHRHRQQPEWIFIYKN